MAISRDALLAQNKIITQQLENLTKTLAQLPKELKNVEQVQQQVCGQCAFLVEALEDVNFMENKFPYRQGNYNHGWKSHPSMGQGQNGQAGQAGQFNRPQQQQSIWQQISALNEKSTKLEETLQQFIQVTISNHNNNEAAIRNMEIQSGQMAKDLKDKPEKNFGVDDNL
ncbi:hypothetical protein LR48_Vigan05g074800 [Vigna angularis]|uniref:Uncharacterized protein n=1 Tax=Phaseolus angularis TaxID=3914 RepID=A0A0L9UKQ4_PHAAN|nr:hypothetical protein LR48_Vigan05g074800 [Vigna angularis]